MGPSSPTDQALTASPGETPWLVRRWWVFPSLLIAIALAAAATHREVPLSVSVVPPDVLRAVEAASSASAVERTWTRLHLTSERTFTQASGEAVRSKVRTSWQWLSPLILRRSDDWYDIGGSKALYQERSISGLGLVNLRWAERQPAPIYHDIFEDDGWFGETTTSLWLSVDSGFPLMLGSRLKSSAHRQSDKVPGQRSKERGTFERVVTCEVTADQSADVIHPSITGRVAIVDCNSATREAHELTPQPSGRTRYAYSLALGAFLPVERQERAPKSPFEADDAPPRWASTSIRYAAVRVEP
jgi:hypothetical protein